MFSAPGSFIHSTSQAFFYYVGPLFAADFVSNFIHKMFLPKKPQIFQGNYLTKTSNWHGTGYSPFTKDLEKTKKIAKKFVRYQEGAELYSIGLTKFQELAKEAGGDERSEYGLEVIKKISKELTQRYGKGYDRSNLYHCLKFYKTFPEIVDTACRQSGVLLSWSHYRTLLQVKNPEAREWYEKEAAEQTWSVRTLQRNISSQYYYRMLGTQKKELVESEMKELTAPYQNDKLEFIKNPVVAEFLGFSQNTDFTESDLEKSILSNLPKFLMELGKGYAFVARQQHIHTEKQDYYIDLVFYNYILKCFVLIDLKTEKIRRMQNIMEYLE